MSANEINLFGTIGRTEDGSGITSQQVKTLLAKMDQTQPLVVRIDSEGGSVFDGFSIYEAFASYPGPKKAIVESTAFSIASYIAMAFDDVEIAENGYMMIHEPSTDAHGTSAELAKNAELLAKLDQSMVAAYAKKTGLSEDEARGLMKDETFMNASEAKAFGFVNTINATTIQTRVMPTATHSKNMPQRVYAALFGAGAAGDNRDATKGDPMSTQLPIAATIQEIKAAFPKAKAEFVLRCLEQAKPMASVAQAAVEEMMAENATMAEQVAALTAELTALKAAAPAEGDPAEETKELEGEPPAAKATAKARGAKPVARTAASTGGKSFRAQWTDAVNACAARCGGDKIKAARLANQEFAHIREAMLAEVNG